MEMKYVVLPDMAIVPNPPSYPHMASPWLFNGPEVLYWGPHHVAKLWNVKAIYITENGTSSSEAPGAQSRVWEGSTVPGCCADAVRDGTATRNTNARAETENPSSDGQRQAARAFLFI